MRKKLINQTNHSYKILVVDDDQGIIDTLKVVLGRSGYDIDGCTDPVGAVEIVRNNKYDLLLLDFIMTPIHGNEVVERIRRFNKEIYILLLTGHKDLAPPLETIRQLDIQGYCEKSDRFDQLLLLVESGIKSTEQMRLISDYKEGLSNILRAVPQLYQLTPIDEMPLKILDQLSLIASSPDTFIMLENADSRFSVGDAEIFAGTGRYEDIRQGAGSAFSGLLEQIGVCRSENATVTFNDVALFPLADNQGQPIGVFGVRLPYEGANGILMQMLEIYCKQVSSALSNALMHTIVNKTFESLRMSFLDTIEALRITVDIKDINTRGHSDRVSFYSHKLGQAIRLDDKELETLRIAGIFHDIGKIGISDMILFKDEPLTDAEFAEIRQHPQKGANILSAVSMFKDIASIVLSHHEKIDGTGYPGHLKGDDIPYLSKIIAVADAFDAMMSDRHYRHRLTLDEAKAELLHGKGRQFDPELVDVFLTLLQDSPEIMNSLQWYYAHDGCAERERL